jgi:hypothetical protein
MRYSWLTLSTAIVLGVALSPVTFAQERPATTEAGKRISDFYTPATLVAIRGKVVSLETIDLKPGLTGVVANTDVNGVTIPIVLGSVDFMRNNYIGLKEGADLEITGSKVVIDSKTSVIADTAVIGNRRLVVRDYDGTPAWLARPDVAQAAVYSGSGNPGENQNFGDLYGQITGLQFISQGKRLTGAAVRLGSQTMAFVGNLDYLREKGITLKINDPMHVTGTMGRYNGMRMVIVREIRQGDITVPIRDGYNQPLWREEEGPDYREFSDPIPLVEVEGEVQQEVSFSYGDEEGILVDIKEGGGITRQAFLPARDYLKDRNVEIKPGMKIKMSGPEAIADRKAIVVPNSIELDNTRISLRDASGKRIEMMDK